MTQRGRSGSTGPRGRAAGAPRAGSRAARATARAEPGRAAASAAPANRSAAPAERPRSRLTGRAAVLVLVLAVLTVSYASSMRAYLQQRASINQLKTQIAHSNADITTLSREKKEWNDPAYVQQEAKLRLGYVMPGDTTYLVLDQDGKPMDVQASLDDPATVRTTSPTAWWSDEWDSVELAGHPPKITGRAPATTIDGAQQARSQSSGG